jgi:alpha-1,2-mannosyltransferase
MNTKPCDAGEAEPHGVEFGAAVHWPLWIIGVALTAIGLGAVVIQNLGAVSMKFAEVEDLQVYRGAVQAWLAGGNLYDYQLDLHGLSLPFTYPPFAALMMVPAALLPESVAVAVMVAASAVLTVVIAALLLNQTSLVRYRRIPERWLLVCLGATGLGWSDAVLTGVGLGQISLLLVAAVLIDMLLVPPRWRGILIGWAAALKLTPVVFVGYLLVTRQWRAAVTALGTAVGATAIGFLVLPNASLQYWGTLLWQTQRVGDVAAVRNKSLLGLFYHVGLTGPWSRPLWLLAAVLLAVAGLWQAVRCYRRGEEVAAVLVVGVLATLVSPISWTHHLIWLPATGLYLAYRGGRRARWLGLFVLFGCGSLSPLISYQPMGSVILDALGDVVIVMSAAIVVFGIPAATAKLVTRGDFADDRGSR